MLLDPLHLQFLAPLASTITRFQHHSLHTNMGWRDNWPLMDDDKEYDGKNLMRLIQEGKSPFHGVWDVKLLIKEIEQNLDTKIVDIPYVGKGSNNYVCAGSCIPYSTPKLTSYSFRAFTCKLRTSRT